MSDGKKVEQPTALERAIKAELTRILGEKGPLTPAKLKRLIEVARHGGALLSAVGKDRVALHLEEEHPEEGYGSGEYPGQPIEIGGAETFGARFLRELVPALRDYAMAQKRPSVEQLTRAIVDARTAELPDVEAQLRSELTQLLSPPAAPEQVTGIGPAPRPYTVGHGMGESKDGSGGKPDGIEEAS